MKSAILILFLGFTMAQVYTATAYYGFPVICGNPNKNDSFALVTNSFDNDTYTFDMNATITCGSLTGTFNFILGLVSYPSIDPDRYSFGFTSYLDLTNFTIGPYANNTIAMTGTCYTANQTPTSVILMCNGTDSHISPNLSISTPPIDPNYNVIYGKVTSS